MGYLCEAHEGKVRGSNPDFVHGRRQSTMKAISGGR